MDCFIVFLGFQQPYPFLYIHIWQLHYDKYPSERAMSEYISIPISRFYAVFLMGVYFTKDPKNFSSQIQGGNNYVCSLLKGKLEIFQGYLLSRSVSRLLCLATAQGEISTKKKVEKTQEKVHNPNKPRSGGDL